MTGLGRVFGNVSIGKATRLQKSNNTQSVKSNLTLCTLVVTSLGVAIVGQDFLRKANKKINARSCLITVVHLSFDTQLSKYKILHRPKPKKIRYYSGSICILHVEMYVCVYCIGRTRGSFAYGLLLTCLKQSHNS